MSNANLPAFPLSGEGQPKTDCGLTKREYFAGLAMQGILAGSAEVQGAILTHAEKRGFEFTEAALSAYAVSCSDALLAELKKAEGI